MMIPRISIVDNINIIALGLTGVFNIGDAKFIDSSSQFLSVKRSDTTFLGSEGDTMRRHKVFSEVPSFEPIYEQITMSFINDIPYINVNELSITGITGAFAHIGSGDTINLESKVLNIFEEKE